MISNSDFHEKLQTLTFAADREKVEAQLKRDSSTNAAINTATDEAVKPAVGTGKPLGKTGDQTENTIRPKPIFDRSGYDVPKSVANQYVAHEGKFLDRKSETVHFEDKGRSLSTASEDRDVIAAIIMKRTAYVGTSKKLIGKRRMNSASGFHLSFGDDLRILGARTRDIMLTSLCY